VWALILGTGFLAVTALFGGLNLVRDPTGASIDLVIPVDLSHLAGTPFADYLIPGVVLVVCLGLYPLVVLYGQVTRSPWAWVASGAMAVILLGWLAVEVALIGYISPLQPAYGVFGLALIALLAAPTVRAHFDATVGT
jgi:hypothetical protein